MVKRDVLASDADKLTTQAMNTLLSTGEIDPGWQAAYRSWTDEARQRMGQDRWPAQLLRSLHRASMYMPIWYIGWQRPDQANRDTEKLLAALAFDCESILWKAYARSQSGGHELDFVLREASEIRRHPTLRSEFDLHCRRAIDDLRIDWQKSDVVFVRDFVLIHFTSFYLDWLLQRDLLDAVLPSASDEQEQVIEQLTQSLSAAGVNSDASWLIECWLRACPLPRDQSGLPTIGTKRRSSAPGLRAHCEALLLGG